MKEYITREDALRAARKAWKKRLSVEKCIEGSDQFGLPEGCMHYEEWEDPDD